MAKTSLVVGARSSPPHLQRAERVVARLRQYESEIPIRLQSFTTAGDRLIAEGQGVADKRLFTHELEQALAQKRLDAAVFALKDLPATLPAGLCVAAVLERGQPAETWVSRDNLPISESPANTRVVVAGALQAVQLLQVANQFEYTVLAGPAARLRALDARQADAAVVAYEDLVLLGQAKRATEELSTKTVVPPVGQGVTALVCRVDDREAFSLLRQLSHQDTETVTLAERAFLRELEGEATVPLGALAELEEDEIALAGVLVSLDGDKMFRMEARGRRGASETVGLELANQFVLRGSRVLAGEMVRLAPPGEDEM